jgi:predicted dienelactone hydrolase
LRPSQKLSRFEQKTPEEQEIERRKIKEAIAAKLKEKEQIISAVRKSNEQKKQTEQQVGLRQLSIFVMATCPAARDAQNS